MSSAPLLTSDETKLLSWATEHWLRLGEVEFNPGEQALALLTQADMRPDGCRRDDIASLNWTVVLELADGKEVRELTLVSPRDADISRRRVSVLTPLGLNLLGRSVGSTTRIPLATGGSRSTRIIGVRRCAELAGEAAGQAIADGA
ncbi:GreA/GreB family elongation factor [Variovorax saccharolyticus]|uniref:GreA/GreB family elongation factor n=1 Tax=Variovorax saccharolyticus TaxID=3053516 RepID=UPI0025758D23|nr:MULTISPECIES: GreA/GreB family elongation factor [unclassified Variovorax]MDM0018323.1 GreA/GreB family elongation factor [Variovorax sp. J22R187]MDM0024485.1 GreA/GreB family elongation factor [Variovorax sp. J31P216]